jgi:hypothetical protein
VHLALVVKREHEQALREIEVHTRKLAIMELGVLRAIRQVNEHVHNLLATLRGTHLVQLVKLEHWIHAASANQRLHNVTAHRTLLGEGVSHEHRGIRCTSQ